jgi:hypothetical protein
LRKISKSGVQGCRFDVALEWARELTHEEDQRTPSSWGKDTDYRDACDIFGKGFGPDRTLIETAAHVSGSQLARRLRTSQACIARMEDGTVRPSAATLKRFAQATRRRLRIAAPLTHP